MEICFLGTGAGYPTPKRGASAVALRYEGGVYLIDCGEGTQTQIMAIKFVKPANIAKIFITHLHGDHMFGLPGLLCTLSMAHATEIEESQKRQKKKVIEIFGPVGLRRFIRESLNLSRSMLEFTYVVHELVPNNDHKIKLKPEDPDWKKWNPDHLASGPLHISEENYGRAIFYDPVLGCWPIFDDSKFTVSAGHLVHRIPSFGYVFQEKSKPGKLNNKKLIDFGVPKGPLFARIKNGEEVTLEDGRVVNPKEFIGPTRPGRKIAILQDTCDSSAMRNMCESCDVLIHEATNEDCHEEKSIENGHSTPNMAARFAVETNSKMLVLNHVSQRYKNEITHAPLSEGSQTTALLEEQARNKFSGPVIAAYDGLVIDVKMAKL